MLVLTRKAGQSIVVADNVEIKVLEIHGNQVKLGVQAPGSVPIHRKEVYVAIQRENQAAASVPQPASDEVSEALRKLKPEEDK